MADLSLAPGVMQAGDVEFKVLEIIDTKNNNARYNLLGSFIDFTIYEDIFSPVLTGYVALVESQNFISTIPIVGEELLYAEFQTPGRDPVSCLFHISEVGLREHNDKKNAYTLELISYEGFKDLNLRFSSAYAGNTSEMAKNFYKKVFNKELDADVSDNRIKFVSPYWGPLKIINHIASKATFPNAKMVTPDYLFYQTSNGTHKFKSLSKLMASEPHVDYFFDKNPSRVHDNEGKSVRDIDREYKNIIDLTFVSSQNFVKSMMDGSYNHRLYSIDMLRKKVAVKAYHYASDFGKTTHTDANPLTTLNTTKFSGLHTVKHKFPFLFDGVDDIGDEIASKRIPLLAQLDIFKLHAVVHGRTDMEVGKTVNVWLNQFKSIDQSDVNTNETYDQLYSGKYLITAIQHRFTQAKHQMNMELVKTGTFKEIETK